MDAVSVIDVVNAGGAMEKLSIIGLLSVALGVTFYMLRDKKTLDDALTRIASAMERNNEMTKLMTEIYKDLLQERLDDIKHKQERVLEELLRISNAR